MKYMPATFPLYSRMNGQSKVCVPKVMMNTRGEDSFLVFHSQAWQSIQIYQVLCIHVHCTIGKGVQIPPQVLILYSHLIIKNIVDVKNLWQLKTYHGTFWCPEKKFGIILSQTIFIFFRKMKFVSGVVPNNKIFIAQNES
jgi:hypothetical protein